MKKIMVLFCSVMVLAAAGPDVSFAQTTETLPKLKEGEPLPNDLFVKLAKAVNPAVVNIYTAYLPKRPQFRGGGRGYPDPMMELFEQFMLPPNAQTQPAQSLGTGFIIREDGLIITNNHVIDQADEIKVKLDEVSKESFDAEVIGKDARTDIALIKIKTNKKLPVVRFGSSKDLQVGEWVAAFGNPYGHGHSMTKGIVSAIGREIEELNMLPFIQTDASINPGNSGGPMVNTQGLVVGVNTAIDARAQGIGFAIPIDQVKELIPQLEKSGEIKRGFLGIGLQDLDETSAKMLKLKETYGAIVTQVFPNTPASRAGLKAHDVIQEFNGKKVEDSKALSMAVMQTPVGQKVSVKVFRDGRPKDISLQIGANNEAERSAMERGRSPLPNGQNAPFDLGFQLVEYSDTVAKNFGFRSVEGKYPIVVDVKRRSKAASSGLEPGDLILDVNKKNTPTVKDVFKALKKDGNVLRVFKDGRVVLIGV